MFEDKIKRIIRDLDNVIEIAKAESVQQIYGDSLQRIFDKGQDKFNNQIGKYNPNFVLNGKNYIQTRKDKGLQTAFVDLTFTTALNKSIARNKDQIYFSNSYGRVIAAKNEKNFNKRIFAPSKDEAKVFIDILNEELVKLWK
jgi:hypothetical protein